MSRDNTDVHCALCTVQTKTAHTAQWTQWSRRTSRQHCSCSSCCSGATVNISHLRLLMLTCTRRTSEDAEREWETGRRVTVHHWRCAPVVCMWVNLECDFTQRLKWTSHTLSGVMSGNGRNESSRPFNRINHTANCCDVSAAAPLYHHSTQYLLHWRVTFFLSLREITTRPIALIYRVTGGVGVTLVLHSNFPLSLSLSQENSRLDGGRDTGDRLSRAP